MAVPSGVPNNFAVWVLVIIGKNASWLGLSLMLGLSMLLRHHILLRGLCCCCCCIRLLLHFFLIQQQCRHCWWVLMPLGRRLRWWFQLLRCQLLVLQLLSVLQLLLLVLLQLLQLRQPLQF